MICHYCKEKCAKKGFTLIRVQRYYCKRCNKFQQSGYSKSAKMLEACILLYMDECNRRPYRSGYMLKTPLF